MAKYTREELFGDEKEGQSSHKGHEIVTRLSREKTAKSLVKVPYRSIDDTKELIVFFMEQQTYPIARSEIARLVGRHKTPTLNRLIEELVTEGVLLRYETTRANRATMFYYEFRR
jgi:hypothetical protein